LRGQAELVSAFRDSVIGSNMCVDLWLRSEAPPAGGPGLVGSAVVCV